MRKIVECVPNFSEGRDKKIIDAISDAIKAVKGVTLLDVDPGKSTNRTVYTFVGDPESIVNGAIAAAKVIFRILFLLPIGIVSCSTLSWDSTSNAMSARRYSMTSRITSTRMRLKVKLPFTRKF